MVYLSYEFQLEDNMWTLVDNDPLNRRYTGATVMDLSGPVANTELTVTRFSQDGSQAPRYTKQLWKWFYSLGHLSNV